MSFTRRSLIKTLFAVASLGPLAIRKLPLIETLRARWEWSLVQVPCARAETARHVSKDEVLVLEEPTFEVQDYWVLLDHEWETAPDHRGVWLEGYPAERFHPEKMGCAMTSDKLDAVLYARPWPDDNSGFGPSPWMTE